MIFNQNFSFANTPPLNITSIIVNLVIFIVVLIGAIILFWRLKITSKGYKLLFVFYTFFWFPLMLVRSYRGTLNNDLEVSPLLLFIPLSVYGFVGIFVRPLFDWMGARFQSRKAIIFIALWIQLITFLPVAIAPSFATNVIQAVGVGIGASCIGSFSLWFNEQHTRTKPFLTISILSLPPLIADFLASPIQALIRTTSPFGSSSSNIAIHADPNWTAYLWVIAIIVILFSFAIGYFVKEKPDLVGLQQSQNKQVIKTKWQWIMLMGIVIVGASIDFTKFASADAIATTTIQHIGGSVNTRVFDGYVTSVFSIFQLIGGILMGFVGIRYFSKIVLYLFGAIFFIAYDLSVILIARFDNNTLNGAIAYLGVQALNGFGYGVLYNLLIAHILSLGFKTKNFSPLGLYQAIAALSISAGTFFTSAVQGFLRADFAHVQFIINLTLICVTLVMSFIYYFVNYIEKDFKHKPLWQIQTKI
ncbi:MFS transporter [[Mycoplasma] testudinis]|uniref:hypothetical protein n=1 Tax=[Mycoplasma] testudinis TaxID=33924 RepID=UPI000696778B|nr:hypothetical protein [[Mycoplasma] testudinis]